jgi:enoyl-CoA hydratase/carnithine racemase
MTGRFRNVAFDREGPIAWITMDRPERRNALSLEHLRELLECLRAVGEDGESRVAVVRASGPAFSAGHDLSEMIGRDQAFYRDLFAACAELMETLQAIPQPVIAEVQGIATAAGCQLVASCDLAVAAAEARFATPGVKIGLFCTTPMVALTRNVAPKHAMEMLLTGDAITAEDAHRIGLVNRVAPPGGERAEAMRLARLIASKSARAIRAGKRAFHAQRTMGLDDAYAHASRVMVENLLDPDANEGIGAFLAKRPPQWNDG